MDLCGSRSTTHLLDWTHDCIVDLGCTNNIDVVYIEFSSAFDSIVFSKLLFKYITVISLVDYLPGYLVVGYAW